MCTRVFALLVLQVGLSNCFSWDIVEGVGKRLEFYYYGTLTHTEDIPSVNDIRSIVHDPVHNRLLFSDATNPGKSLTSFDLSTRKKETLETILAQDHLNIAYDPVTQLLFWKDDLKIYSFSLNPTSLNKSVGSNLIIQLKSYCWDIAVDSCGGYIYWTTPREIERARFDGSEREVIIDSNVNKRSSLAIDLQTQRIYWIEEKDTSDGYQLSIESADLEGNNEITLYILKNETLPSSLTVSKDFIYWRGDDQKAIWQLKKNICENEEVKLFSISHSSNCWYCKRIAVNYTIMEQTDKNQNCKTLKSLLNYSEPDVSVLSVDGTKVSGASLCECTQGYTGEKCDVSICQNYCLHGDCSVSAEEKPKCRCKAGYSGERCEIDACHKHCLNSGVCSLNEEDEAVCHCTAHYEGERCEVPVSKDFRIEAGCSVNAEGQLKVTVTLEKGMK